MAKNYWVIAPYLYDSEHPSHFLKVWENNLRRGFISIGFRALGNAAGRSREAIKEIHREVYPEESEGTVSADSSIVWRFLNLVKVGDVVVARCGRKILAGIGTVTREPYFDQRKAKAAFPDDPTHFPYPNHVDVDWSLENRDLVFDRQVFGMQAIHSISEEKLDELLTTPLNPTDFPDELPDPDTYTEGGVREVKVNAYERNPQARNACLEAHGYSCKVCDMNFADVYGEIGIGFIHVHHLKPVAMRLRRYKVDPVRDLVPVCPNCHAMLHRSSPEPYTIQKLRSIYRNNRRATHEE